MSLVHSNDSIHIFLQDVFDDAFTSVCAAKQLDRGAVLLTSPLSQLSEAASTMQLGGIVAGWTAPLSATPAVVAGAAASGAAEGSNVMESSATTSTEQSRGTDGSATADTITSAVVDTIASSQYNYDGDSKAARPTVRRYADTKLTMLVDEIVEAEIVDLIDELIPKIQLPARLWKLGQIKERYRPLYHTRTMSNNLSEDDKDSLGRPILTKANYLYLIVQGDWRICKVGVTKATEEGLLKRYFDRLAVVHQHLYVPITNGKCNCFICHFCTIIPTKLCI